jgi:Ca2+-binding EF-hand superfamily protein
MSPREKKTETLEVRLPHATKRAFMDRCREEGRSASEVVREMIDGYLGRPGWNLREQTPMKRRLIYPAAFAAAAVTAGVMAATASSAGPDLRPIFRDLDRNSDGLVTLAEFTAATHGDMAARLHGARSADSPAGRPPFMHADADRDGSVSYAEFESHHRTMLAEAFAGLDGDRDGRVSHGEFLSGHAGASPEFLRTLERAFSDFDRDHDGAVSRAELGVD